MKLHYNPETDSLYIDLNQKPSADSREIADGLVVDFDSEGRVVGIDIQHASKTLDLNAGNRVSSRWQHENGVGRAVHSNGSSQFSVLGVTENENCCGSQY